MNYAAISIARAVIENVLTGWFQPVHARRDRPDGMDQPHSEPDRDMREWLDGKVIRCCALAACFVPALDFGPALTLRDAEVSAADTAPMPPILKYLGDYFSEAQMEAIEAAYELGDGWFSAGHVPPKSDTSAAVAFGQRYSRPDERMNAIMLNILANDGEFVPGAEMQP